MSAVYGKTSLSRTIKNNLKIQLRSQSHFEGVNPSEGLFILKFLTMNTLAATYMSQNRLSQAVKPLLYILNACDMALAMALATIHQWRTDTSPKYRD